MNLTKFIFLSCLAALSACAQVPSTFQDLYNTLGTDITAFQATVSTASPTPVIFSASLSSANANIGPGLLGPYALQGVQNQLQALKAIGVGSVTIELGFPMFNSTFLGSDYNGYVSFYQQAASAVRAQGMKLVIENDTLIPSGVQAGWTGLASFYSTLNWTNYQSARAAAAAAIASNMLPDYLVVVEEPGSEASNTGQTSLNTPASAAALASTMLASVRATGVSVSVGAGVANWQPSYDTYTTDFAAISGLDFIDMHVYPVNDGYWQKALTIASIAAAAGKPVGMTECWLWKTRDSEVSTLSPNDIQTRSTFSFWGPEDISFLTTMKYLAYYTGMIFFSPMNTKVFFAYEDYNTVGTWTNSQIIAQEAADSAAAMASATYDTTGSRYHRSILAPATDTTTPSVPTGLSGSSGSTSSVWLSWTASTDDIGVAGYSIQRNGTTVATNLSTSFQDTGLTEATTYTYTVKAFDLGGNVSAASASTQVQTKDVTPPTAPTTITPTVISRQEIDLAWSGATDNGTIGSYKIFRGTSPSSLTLAGSRATSPMINYPLAPGNTYYFAVETVDTWGNTSPMSATVSATTLP